MIGWLVVAALVYAVTRPGPAATPSSLPREWVPLKTIPGLRVRSAPDRTWVRRHVAQQVWAAAEAAAAQGITLWVGDGSRDPDGTGPAPPGGAFPPHKSHKDGYDLDIALAQGWKGGVDAAHVALWAAHLKPSVTWSIHAASLPESLRPQVDGVHKTHAHVRWERV